MRRGRTNYAAKRISTHPHHFFATALSGMLMISFIAACNKQHTEDHHKNEARFTVASPTQGGTYSLNDSVLIQCTIAATEGLHGYSVGVRSAADTNTVFYFEHIHQHSDSVNIRMKWKGNLSQPSNLELLLEALLDDNGTMARKRVGFRQQ